MTNINDFSSWPPPPPDHRAELQWNHRDWDKLGEGQYVYAREVRESFLDCHCVWSTINEDCNVPKLLDEASFKKYCYYYMRREDMHLDDYPLDYTPLDFEKDEESKEEWSRRQLQRRFKEQYCDKSPLELMLDEKFGQSKSKAKPDVNSKANQYYIKAVKANRPDAIRKLFSKGTSKICPNCLERFDRDLNMRRGVVYYAMKNLYDNSKSRSDALECLELVCSLDGVDVNADTWYTPFRVGPPLWTAIGNFDSEAIQILLRSGARTVYPDVVGLDGQWCALLQPFEYKTKQSYHTAIHSCINAIESYVPDQEMSRVLQLLVEGREEETLVKAEVGDTPSGMTALEMLTSFVEAYNKLSEEDDDGEPPLEFPLSVAILQNTMVKAEGRDEHETGYKGILTSAELASTAWAEIGDLDSVMYEVISQYITIDDWLSIRKTCKCLTSFPKPPSPQIDYHLIRFSISDWRYSDYHGLAKTLPAVVEAYRFLASKDDGLNQLTYEFIHISDIDQPIIPLTQYPRTEHMEWSHFQDKHPGGERHFGVRAVDENLKQGSPVKKFLSMSGEVWYNGDAETVGKDVLFDDTNMVKALVWLRDTKPSRDINLRHLWHTEGPSGRYDSESYEIWFNSDRAEASCFDSDEQGTWVVSKYHTSVWST